MFGFEGKVVQHPYRTARATEIFLVLPRDFCEELEKKLAETAGKPVDNHVVYAVECDLFEGNQTTYIWFSDFTVRFGREINIGRW